MQGNKEPWLAVLLSAIIPGLGHWYANCKLRGVIALVISGLAIVLFLGLILIPTVSIWWLATGLALCVLPRFVIMADAWRCIQQQNTSDFEAERKKNKDPWLGMCLSALFWPFGLIYLKNWRLLGLSLVVFVICHILLGYISGFSDTIANALTYGFTAWFILQNAGNRCDWDSRLRIKMVIVFMLGPLVFTYRTALSLRQFVVQTSKMYSTSMVPTVKVGDRIVVQKFGLNPI